MRKLMIALIAACALAGCSRAPVAYDGTSDGPFPIGSYKIRAAQVDYQPDMSYRIFDAKQVFVEGRYAVDGSTITMTDVGGKFGCKENPAKYKWSSNGKSIKLDLLEDRCQARREAMAESPFEKIDQ